MVKLVNYIKREEFEQIIPFEKNKRCQLAYRLGFGSGLRISEIIGLEWLYSRCCDIRIVIRPEKRNNVKHKITYCSKCNKELSLKETYRKKGDWQIKPLMAEQIDVKDKTIAIIGGKGMKDRKAPLFDNFREEYLKLLPIKIPRRTLQYKFQKLCEKVLKKKLSFHKLRHGFGVTATKDNIPMPYIQQAMGHSRLDTTGIYTFSSPDEMVKAFHDSKRRS